MTDSPRTALMYATQMVKSTEKAWNEALVLRDSYVVDAAADGMTHQQIADLTGLTRGRVGQIVRKDQELDR